MRMVLRRGETPRSSDFDDGGNNRFAGAVIRYAASIARKTRIRQVPPPRDTHPYHPREMEFWNLHWRGVSWRYPLRFITNIHAREGCVPVLSRLCPEFSRALPARAAARQEPPASGRPLTLVAKAFVRDLSGICPVSVRKSSCQRNAENPASYGPFRISFPSIEIFILHDGTGAESHLENPPKADFHGSDSVSRVPNPSAFHPPLRLMCSLSAMPKRFWKRNRELSAEKNSKSTDCAPPAVAPLPRKDPPVGACARVRVHVRAGAGWHAHTCEGEGGRAGRQARRTARAGTAVRASHGTAGRSCFDWRSTTATTWHGRAGDMPASQEGRRGRQARRASCRSPRARRHARTTGAMLRAWREVLRGAGTRQRGLPVSPSRR